MADFSRLGTSEPRAAVYHHTGAIGRLCPTCNAEPGQWCDTPLGPKRIPHIARSTDATLGGTRPGERR